MRIIALLVLAISLTVLTSVGAPQSVPNKGDQSKTDSSKNPDSTLSPAERKAREEANEAAQEQYESDLKALFKRPAEININAPAAKVRSLLIQAFTKENYHLTKNSNDGIVFERPGKVMVRTPGDAPRQREGYQITTFQLSSSNETTTLQVDLKLEIRIRGYYERVDMNKDLRARRWLSYMLQDLRRVAEKP